MRRNRGAQNDRAGAWIVSQLVSSTESPQPDRAASDRPQQPAVASSPPMANAARDPRSRRLRAWRFVLLPVLVVVCVFILASLWEFILEPFLEIDPVLHATFENTVEKWETVFLACLFTLFGLCPPTYLFLRFERLHQQASEQLSAREQWMRDFAEATGARFWETGPDHRFTFVAETHFPATVPFLGEALGMTRWQLAGAEPDSEEQWRRHRDDLEAHRPFVDFRYTFDGAVGAHYRWSVSGRPLFDRQGEFLGYRGVAHQVTTAVAARGEIRSAQARLAAAIEAFDDSVSLYDSEDRLVICNRTFRSRLAPLGDLLDAGTSFADMIKAATDKGMVPEAKGREEAWIQDRLAKRRNPGEPFEQRTWQGHWLLFQEQRLPDGGTLSFCSDITARKQDEARARVAKEEAEAANLAKSRFLAAASHDLRQPLHALGMFAASLDNHVSGDRGRDLLAKMERSIDALSDSFGALIDLSTLEAGVSKATLSAFSMDGILDRLREEYQPLARSKQIELRILRCGARVCSDPALLDRILRNLLSNAVNYTERGRVLVGCRRHKQALRIEVWDSGPGIPADRIERIFEEFYRADPSGGGRGASGLGLGLAIVRQTARLLEHRIEVSSQPGKGSVFAVEVPYAIGPAVGRAEAPVAVAGDTSNSLSGRFVLVLDDEVDVADGMQQLLEEWGCDVLAACSGGEMLDSLKDLNRVPDAAIVDYSLGEGDSGLIWLRRIFMQVGRDLPVIFVSAATSPEVLAEVRAGGFEILDKPLRPAKLRALLSYLVRGRA